MNTILALSLITTYVLAAAGLAILALTIAGIQYDERRLSLPAPLDTLARRVLGAHVSPLNARHILAAGHGPPPARRQPALTSGDAADTP